MQHRRVAFTSWTIIACLPEDLVRTAVAEPES